MTDAAIAADFGRLDSAHGKPAGSVRRFSVFKWLMAAILAVLLILFGLSPSSRRDDGPVGVPGAAGTPASGQAVAPAAGSAPPRAEAGGSGAASGSAATLAAASSPAMIFALERDPDGRLRARGSLPDAATRDVWMNAIRLGAQQVPVADDLGIGDAATESSQWYSLWSTRLGALTALARERQLSSLRIEGNRVLIRGDAATPAEREETERLIQAQIPPGFRVESQIAVSQQALGASAVSGSAPAAAAAGSGLAGSGLAAAGNAAGGPAGSNRSAAAGASPAAGATPAAGSRAGKATAARPANCPASLTSLTVPVYFGTDGTSISNRDRARLQRLGGCLGSARLRIVGRADPRYTDEYNRALSERRARAVAAEIQAGGADASRLSIAGAGATGRSGRQSVEALQRSRRVDIQVR